MNAKLEGSVLPIEYSLDARFAAVSGTVFLTGIQALVRVLVDRERLDSMRGLQTAGFVSGYRGSPLGGLDKTLAKEGDRLERHRIKFEPGINEDLAATAVWGSQQVGVFRVRFTTGSSACGMARHPASTARVMPSVTRTWQAPHDTAAS